MVEEVLGLLQVDETHRFTVVVFGILFTVVTWLLSLPLDWYSGFVREHAYGLSDQTAAKWWKDSFTGLALGCVVTALTLWLPYWLLRASPRQYQQRVRIERARRLLAEGQSIARVAQSCGFSEHSAFSRRFKAVVGTTPMQYRKHALAQSLARR